MSVLVRRFQRGDRDQVAALVNAHIAAVIPNVAVSVNALMSHLERQPGEFIVDQWVRERVSLVAVQRSRVVAAAQLLRYIDDDRASDSYRDAAEIRWLLCWPPAPYWPDSTDAGEQLARVCLAQLDRWRPRVAFADGTLPAPGVYGVPEQWPHIRDLYLGCGFVADGHAEVVYLAQTAVLLEERGTPGLSLTVRRSLGINGTRLSAIHDGEVVGYVEVDTNLDAAVQMSRVGDLADIGNLHVVPEQRRKGIGSWLVAKAADWLDLGGVTRVLAYCDVAEPGERAFLEAVGFDELTRTQRGFTVPHAT